jgi:polyhydroxyalkanoate synthesis regulator phasin
MEDKFYKLITINFLLKETSSHRQKLFEELVDSGTDNNIVTRRLKMLSDLAMFEVQALEKIKNFKTLDVEDYASARVRLIQDLNHAVSRNA